MRWRPSKALLDELWRHGDLRRRLWRRSRCDAAAVVGNTRIGWMEAVGCKRVVLGAVRSSRHVRISCRVVHFGFCAGRQDVVWLRGRIGSQLMRHIAMACHSGTFTKTGSEDQPYDFQEHAYVQSFSDIASMSLCLAISQSPFISMAGMISLPWMLLISPLEQTHANMHMPSHPLWILDLLGKLSM